MDATEPEAQPVEVDQQQEESKTEPQNWSDLKFDREESKCKGKELLNWRKETRQIITKLKASDLDEIKNMKQLPEPAQKTVNATLHILGYKTPKEKKEAWKEYKSRKLDIVKEARTKKPAALSFEDCNSKLEEDTLALYLIKKYMLKH